MPIKSFYFKERDLPTLEKFFKICKMEGIAQGSKLVELMDKHNARHQDGNPQTSLDYAGLFKTLPRYKTCVHSQKEQYGGVFFCYFNRPREGHSQGTYPPSRCDKCTYYEHEDDQDES